MIYERNLKFIFPVLFPKSTFIILHQNVWTLINTQEFFKNAFLENVMILLGSSNERKCA